MLDGQHALQLISMSLAKILYLRQQSCRVAIPHKLHFRCSYCQPLNKVINSNV